MRRWYVQFDSEFKVIFLIVMIAFPVAWLLIFWVLTRLSGWRELSAIYRYENPIRGTWYRMQTVYMGSMVYGGMDIIRCANGLCLHQPLVYRLFHPTLLIPWDEIHYEGMTRIVFSSYAVFRVEQTSTSLYIPAKVINEGAKISGANVQSF